MTCSNIEAQRYRERRDPRPITVEVVSSLWPVQQDKNGWNLSQPESSRPTTTNLSQSYFYTKLPSGTRSNCSACFEEQTSYNMCRDLAPTPCDRGDNLVYSVTVTQNSRVEFVLFTSRKSTLYADRVDSPLILSSESTPEVDCKKNYYKFIRLNHL